MTFYLEKVESWRKVLHEAGFAGDNSARDAIALFLLANDFECIGHLSGARCPQEWSGAQKLSVGMSVIIPWQTLLWCWCRCQMNWRLWNHCAETIVLS